MGKRHTRIIIHRITYQESQQHDWIPAAQPEISQWQNMIAGTRYTHSTACGTVLCCLVPRHCRASQDHFAVFVSRGFGKNEAERTGKANISRLEVLAVVKACYAGMYSHSTFRKREPLVALGPLKIYCLHLPHLNPNNLKNYATQENSSNCAWN